MIFFSFELVAARYMVSKSLVLAVWVLNLYLFYACDKRKKNVKICVHKGYFVLFIYFIHDANRRMLEEQS